MKNLFIGMTAATALAVGASGCYVYDPYHPYGYTAVPNPNAGAATYDRSWNAMLGAFSDQGLAVVAQDRAAGTIEGRKAEIRVTAHVFTQADGTIRAEFNAGGQLSQDPGLPDRISRAYDARMGR
jgi:hypothetical protein